MRKQIYSTILAILLVSSCAGDKSVKVDPLQRKDKELSCSEIMLEINEAEFYRKSAENNKNIKVKSLLMPLGYISSYMNAEDASSAANARIDYLNRIYDILRCGEADKEAPATVRNNGPRQGGYMIVPAIPAAPGSETVPGGYILPQSYSPSGQPALPLSPGNASYRANQDTDWYY